MRPWARAGRDLVVWWVESARPCASKTGLASDPWSPPSYGQREGNSIRQRSIIAWQLAGGRRVQYVLLPPLPMIPPLVSVLTTGTTGTRTHSTYVAALPIPAGLL